MHVPASPRLHYRRLDAAHLEVFHALVTDPFVLRYLMDGQVMPMRWSLAAIHASDALFAATGVGLWLLAEPECPEVPIGFAGFRVFSEMGPEPQLLYALREPHTGRGLATEAAGAMIATGRAAGMTRIPAAVDTPNVASLRVLEKLGFRRTGRVPGAFGETILLELPAE